MITIYDMEKDEIIIREMNKAELALHNERAEINAAKEVEAKAKAVEKQAILDRIGLTADELQTILG